MNQRYQYLNHFAGFQEEALDIPWEDAKEQQIKTRRAKKSTKVQQLCQADEEAYKCREVGRVKLCGGT